MFRLVDSARRRWCRRLFLALGVAPTLAIAIACSALHSSFYVRAIERRLGQALDVLATVEGVAHPRPGVIELHGVVLSDPDTGRPLAAAQRARRLADAQQWQFQVARLSVDVAAGPAWRERWFRALRAQISPLPQRWEINAVTCQQGPHAVELRQVTASVDPAKGTAGARALVEGAAEPVQLKLLHARSADGAQTVAELNCNAAPLPAWLVLCTAADPLCLGGAATFQGFAHFSTQPAGLRGQLTGKARRVDLQRLSRDLPAPLSGEAELAIQSLGVVEGRVTQLRAAFSAGPGQVSRALIESLRRELALSSFPLPADLQREAQIPYREIAAELTLDDQGLALRGRCQQPGSNVLLLLDSGPVLSDRPEPFAAAHLVRALAAPTTSAWTLDGPALWLAQHVRLTGSAIQVAMPSQAPRPSGGVRPAVELASPPQPLRRPK